MSTTNHKEHHVFLARHVVIVVAAFDRPNPALKSIT
jgi:hypothetical protein